MEETRAKVLVVDDEESVRDVLCETLVEAGEEVISAADGQDALDLLSASDVGVMLLDIRMPGLSGLDVLREVQVRSPATCVIMVTAMADLATGVNAMKQGAYDYVTKPFDVDAIATAVRRAHEHGSAVRPRRRLLPSERWGRFTDGSPVSSRQDLALRIAYLLMLGCAGYAPIELARLIVWHHDTYDQLTLVPVFGLELAVLAWGILGVVVAVAHTWLGVFGFRGRRTRRPITPRVHRPREAAAQPLRVPASAK